MLHELITIRSALAPSYLRRMNLPIEVSNILYVVIRSFQVDRMAVVCIGLSVSTRAMVAGSELWVLFRFLIWPFFMDTSKSD
jgi:hypothetical protein